MKKENLFTKEEIEVAAECIFRRIILLEESGLTDSKCYPLLVNFRRKLLNLDENIKADEETREEL